jgi:DNA repair protein RecO (recombination protein O)
MIFADQLIVLHSTRTGEKSLVMHCLSRRLGRRSFLVTAGSKVPQALWQPLSLLNAELIENPHSDLWRLRSLVAEEPLSGIRSNPAKNAVSLFMSEVLYRVMRSGTGDAAFFDWCAAQIRLFDSLEEHYASFHLCFLLGLCRELGFAPDAGSIAPFAGPCLGRLTTLCSADTATALLLPMKGEDRSAIAAVLLQYLSYHAECNLEVKSLAVLREIF